MVVEGGTKKLVSWLLATVLIGEVFCHPFGSVRETVAIFFPKCTNNGFELDQKVFIFLDYIFK